MWMAFFYTTISILKVISLNLYFQNTGGYSEFKTFQSSIICFTFIAFVIASLYCADFVFFPFFSMSVEFSFYEYKIYMIP